MSQSKSLDTGLAKFSYSPKKRKSLPKHCSDIRFLT